MRWRHWYQKTFFPSTRRAWALDSRFSPITGSVARASEVVSLSLLSPLIRITRAGMARGVACPDSPTRFRRTHSELKGCGQPRPLDQAHVGQRRVDEPRHSMRFGTRHEPIPTNALISAEVCAWVCRVRNPLITTPSATRRSLAVY